MSDREPTPDVDVAVPVPDVTDEPGADRPRASMSSGAALTFVSKIAAMGLSFFTSVMTARALGPAGKGELALLLQAPAMAAVILDLGLNVATSYYVGHRKRTPSQAFSDTFAAALVIAAVGVPASFLFMRFGMPALKDTAWQLIGFSALVLIPTLMNNYLGAILLGLGEIKRLAMRQIFASTFGVTVTTVLFFTGLLDMRTAVATTFASALGLWALQLSGVRRHARPLFTRPSWSRLREEAGYASRVYVAGLASYLDKRQDIVLLGILGTAAGTGVYSVGVVFTQLLWQIPAAMSPVLMSRSFAEDNEAGAALAALASRVSLFITTLAFIGMSLVLPLFIPFAFGRGFTGAVWVFLILSAGTLVYGIALVLIGHLTTRGHVFPKLALSMAAINLLVNVALIPRFGYLGAAFASTISYTLGGVFITSRFCAITGTAPRDVIVIRRTDLEVLRSGIRSILKRGGR